MKDVNQIQEKLEQQKAKRLADRLQSQPGQFNRKGMAYDRTNESWGLAHGNAKVEDTSSSQLSLN